MTTSSPDPDSLSGRQPQQAASAEDRLAYDRTGRGEPLVLLHGQGFSRRCWDPIVDLLAADRDVIAVDLPGHGASPRQPKGTGSAPYDLAVAVTELLDQLGLPTAHVAGSSSGGWVALELGRLQRARTVTALDPAGLWRKSAPRHIRIAMRQVRLTAKITRRVAPNAPRTRLGLGLSLIQASGHPFSLPHEPVKTAVHDMAAAPGFRETLRALEKRQFEDGAAITVPVTVAFGSRDRCGRR
jgi:pimeloyl-ACP methyl ester carboxylesterase